MHQTLLIQEFVLMYSIPNNGRCRGDRNGRQLNFKDYISVKHRTEKVQCPHIQFLQIQYLKSCLICCFSFIAIDDSRKPVGALNKIVWKAMRNVIVYGVVADTEVKEEDNNNILNLECQHT